MRILVLTAAVLLGWLPFRQAQPLTLTGHVVDAKASQPVAGATIRVSGAGSLTVTSDSAGRFVLPGLADGAYTVRASKAGYLGGEYGQLTPLGPGMRVVVQQGRAGAVALRVWKYGVITGRVIDDAGEPVIGAEVGDYPITYEGGYRAARRGRTAKTDDRGVYRLTSTTPGSHIVGAILASADEWHPVTYHPSAPSLGSARSLEIQSGDELSAIDIILPRYPTFALRGRVINIPTGRPSAVARLFSVLDDHDELGRVTVSDGGTFEFGRVPAGQFRIQVESRPAPAQPGGRPWLQAGNGTDSISGRSDGPLAGLPADDMLWATAPAAIVDRDLVVPNVSLARAYSITGRVVFSGGAPRPAAEEIARSAVFVRSRDGSNLGEFPVGRVRDDLTFSTAGVPPGQYVVSPSLRAGPWRLAAVVRGGQTLPNDLVSVADSGPASVELVFTDQRTELSGAVRDSQGRPTSDACVYVFPADSNRWKDFGPLPRSFRRVRAEADGAYRITELPSGAYHVVAAGADVPDNWLNPEFLRRLAAAGIMITIADGNVQNRDLIIRPVRPTQ